MSHCDAGRPACFRHRRQPRHRRQHRRGARPPTARESRSSAATQPCSPRWPRELGGAQRAIPIVADVTDAASVKEAFATARRQFGPVHILVNNAGQAAAAKFIDTDEALWNRILGVNLTGTYLCTREAVRRHAAGRLRADRQHREHRRPERRGLHLRLCDIEACGDRLDALPGPGVRDAEHHRECGVPRIRRHRHREARGRQHHEEDRPQRKRGAWRRSPPPIRRGASSPRRK